MKWAFTTQRPSCVADLAAQFPHNSNFCSEHDIHPSLLSTLDFPLVSNDYNDACSNMTKVRLGPGPRAITKR
jgi:hypothetical protein